MDRSAVRGAVALVLAAREGPMVVDQDDLLRSLDKEDREVRAVGALAARCLEATYITFRFSERLR